MKANNLALSLLFLILFTGCTLSPGMHMSNSKSVYIESIDANIEIKDITEGLDIDTSVYRVGNGDQISITFGAS